MPIDLKQMVRDKISALGIVRAQEFFGVSAGTISNWGSGKTTPSIESAELILQDRPIQSEPLSQWEGRELFIGLPVYRTFNAETHYTLFANYAKYGPEKIAMEIIKQTLIYEARNMLIDRAMKTTAKTFIMCDDDMVLPHGNASYFNGNHDARLPVEMAGRVALSRLMSHGRDKGIVGALYFGRHRRGKAQCASAFTSDNENKSLHLREYEGLKPEEWVGTGLIKIERPVIEKMRAAIDGGMWPELKPKASDQWYGYFTPLGVGIGEDVSFGVRAHKLGIQSYVDTGLECLHIGDRAYGSSNTAFQ